MQEHGNLPLPNHGYRMISRTSKVETDSSGFQWRHLSRDEVIAKHHELVRQGFSPSETPGPLQVREPISPKTHSHLY